MTKDDRRKENAELRIDVSRFLATWRAWRAAAEAQEDEEHKRLAELAAALERIVPGTEWYMRRGSSRWKSWRSRTSFRSSSLIFQKATKSADGLFRCSDPDCPGRPYRATEHAMRGCKP